MAPEAIMSLVEFSSLKRIKSAGLMGDTEDSLLMKC